MAAKEQYRRELRRTLSATPMRYIAAARHQNRKGLDALEDLAEVWADVPLTVELGAVELFLSHLREDMAPSSPREWQLDADFAHISLFGLSSMDRLINDPEHASQTHAIFSGLPGIVKWCQYIYDTHIPSGSESKHAWYLYTLGRLFHVSCASRTFALALVGMPGGLELVTKLCAWEGASVNALVLIHNPQTRTLEIVLSCAISSGMGGVHDRVMDALNGDAVLFARAILRRTKKATKELDVQGGLELMSHIDLIVNLCRPRPHPLRRAFFDAGVITTVTRSFVTFSRAISRNMTESLIDLLPSFINFFSLYIEGDDYFAGVRAIKVGFLRALLDCSLAFANMPQHTVDTAWDIVRETLPPYFVYRSFFHAVTRCMDELKTPHYVRLLAQPAVDAAFAPFLFAMEQQRFTIQCTGQTSFRCGYIKVLPSARSGISQPDMYDLQCQRRDTGHNFKRCKACQWTYYCSPECQKLDWKELHRDSCRAIREEVPLGLREKRDIENLRILARYIADLNIEFFRRMAERNFPDRPPDKPIPCINFTCVPETFALKPIDDAVLSDARLGPFIQRCRSQGLTPVGCLRRNGAEAEFLWLAARRRDFWADESPAAVKENSG
ncbi:hypothetical protein FB45DRAFT_1129978 [Roridomyces roridus]|uniref:MYND-type domain-containing protein n=1 Tax=Roridomyces roridus TaxID=1738132 RepID=A0AAD7B2R2_9AGAR|nr:hypothetical protein FB45DRAFT_1129978 [Roridomyces roridus]